jgi:hypothetical protein
MATSVRQYQNGIEVVTLTIANGASLSDVCNTQGKTLVGIRTPAVWTAAGISFEVNEDAGATSYPLLDPAGIEVTIPSANVPTSAARYFALDYSRFLGCKGVYVRSGTSAAAVNQGGARSLVLYLRSI